MKPKQQTDTEEKPTSLKKEIISWIIYIAAAIALALILRSCVIINAHVPSGSMENTIMTGDDVIGYRLSYLFSEPKRGDIIIFKYPDDESKNYVKRVIGLPGEKVVIRDAKIYIDGAEEPIEEDYLPEEWVRDNGPYVYLVPEGAYFVLGDNRNYSEDARYWEHTYVTKDKIVGKAGFVYFPFDHAGGLK